MQMEWNLYNPKNFIFSIFENYSLAKISNNNKKIVYYKFYNYLKKNCLISVKEKILRPRTVEFHRKYGWILGVDRNYAFLGKIDIANKKLQLIIGRNSYISGPSTFCGHGTIRIGSYSCIAENLKVIVQEDNHDLKKLSFIKIFEEPRMSFNKNRHQKKVGRSFGGITIGNNVWIGRNVTIKNNVSIGDNSAVGESSIVKRDIKSFEIHGGIPAKKIAEVENKKIKIKYSKWWNWSQTKINNSKNLFC